MTATSASPTSPSNQSMNPRSSRTPRGGFIARSNSIPTPLPGSGRTWRVGAIEYASLIASANPELGLSGRMPRGSRGAVCFIGLWTNPLIEWVSAG